MQTCFNPFSIIKLDKSMEGKRIKIRAGQMSNLSSLLGIRISRISNMLVGHFCGMEKGERKRQKERETTITNLARSGVSTSPNKFYEMSIGDTIFFFSHIFKTK